MTGEIEIDDGRPRRNSILQSAQKIEALEQQFNDRTQHEIDLGVTQGANGSPQF